MKLVNAARAVSETCGVVSQQYYLTMIANRSVCDTVLANNAIQEASRLSRVKQHPTFENTGTAEAERMWGAWGATVFTSSSVKIHLELTSCTVRHSKSIL